MKMSTAVEASIPVGQWASVCSESDLIADIGICVLFNGEQVALFKERKSGKIYAISNYDPIGKANVLSRGILGSIGGRLVVASPLYKQHFCLETGQCLESEEAIKTYKVRVLEGRIQISN